MHCGVVFNRKSYLEAAELMSGNNNNRLTYAYLVHIRTAVESSTTQSASRHQKTICLSAVLLADLSRDASAVLQLYSST